MAESIFQLYITGYVLGVGVVLLSALTARGGE